MSPTRLALALSGGPSSEVQQEVAEGYVIVETNYRVRLQFASISCLSTVDADIKSNRILFSNTAQLGFDFVHLAVSTVPAEMPVISLTLALIAPALVAYWQLLMQCMHLFTSKDYSASAGLCDVQVYAYTTSELQVAILRLFVRAECRLPNLFVGTLTRESVTQALEFGVQADQIVSFLQQHAHPHVLHRVPIVPEVCAALRYMHNPHHPLYLLARWLLHTMALKVCT